jgi:Tfp pilus assembly protein PilF
MVQRTEVLAGLFFLSTLFCAVRSLDSPHANRWILGAFVSAALGMGSKESMVTAPLLVILYDRIFVFESLETQFRERRTLYAAVCSTWIVLVVLLAGAPRSASVSLSHAEMSPLTYAITQIGVVVHYLRLSLWPDSLVVDYQGWPIAHSIRDVLPEALLLAALLAATIMALRRRHWLGYAGAWLFVILAPSSSIVPILTEVVAERRMYLPLAAVVIVCVVGLRWLAKSLASRPEQGKAARVAWVTVVVVIAAGLAHASSLRNEDYRSEFAIWSDAVAKRPDNYRARLNLGDYFQTEGKYPEAEEQFAAAVRLSPNTPEARYGLGVALAAQQRTDAAISSYGEALRLDPNYANAHHALGMALVAQGNLDEGIGHYRQALAIKPADSSLRYKLGAALNRQGKTQEAIAEWQEAVRISPGFADAHLVLATALRSTGDVGGARAHLETALKINPNLQAARQQLDEMKGSGR